MAEPDEPSWDDLRTFLALVRAGSLAAAARATGVKHTTVGRRLDALERALGAALVRRGSDGVVPTALGERVARRAEEIERAVAAITDDARAHATRVRIAMPSGLGSLIAPQLGSFHRDHPGVALELLAGSQPVDLGRGDADLAVRIGPVDDPDLVARRVADVGLSLYASAGYLARRPMAAGPVDLAGHDVVGYDASLAATPPARWLDEHARAATVALRCREMSELVAAAVSGAGIALVACWLADAEPALRRLTPDVIASRPLSIVHRREATIAAPVRAALRFLVGVLRGRADALAGQLPVET